nr:S1/P1 Nuclease [Flavobacteriales bacterium]
MKNILLIFTGLVFSLGSLLASEDWGQTGHRVVAEVASENLTSKAKKEIDELLNGMSLAVASTYADEIKSDSRYREFGPWHYVN